MTGPVCGARWCTLPVELTEAANAGLVAALPFLPADATVVGFVLHSHSYPLVRYDAAGRLGLSDAREQARVIRATDRAWPDSPQRGPECRCSRCREPIIDELPVRMQWDDGIHEYRFHGECLGMLKPPDVGAA